MEESYRIQLGIDPSHKVISTGSKSSQRRGQDIDIDTYDVVAEDGTVIAQYEISDAMSIYPPQTRRVSYRTLSGPPHSGVLKPD